MVKKVKKRTAKEPLDDVFMLRCSSTERDAWDAAAAADNRSTAQWLRMVANKAASV